MCGRYGFSIKDADEVYERFDIETVQYDLKPRYNIAPGQINPVIISQSPNTLEGMFWGLIPSWAKDVNQKYSTINAKSETAMSLPTYRGPFRHKRCLVPASFFYEPDKSVKPSIPYLFKMKNDSMFAIAGLYDIWKNPKTGKEIKSYTILTCKPNSLVGKVHPRMPVILKKEFEKEWVSPDITDPEDILHMLKPYPADEMESWQVSGDVWKFKEGPEIIKPITDK